MVDGVLVRVVEHLRGLLESKPGGEDRGPFGIESVQDHGPFFDELLQFCDARSMAVKTLMKMNMVTSLIQTVLQHLHGAWLVKSQSR